MNDIRQINPKKRCNKRKNARAIGNFLKQVSLRDLKTMQRERVFSLFASIRASNMVDLVKVMSAAKIFKFMYYKTGNQTNNVRIGIIWEKH